jgi:hypothetical protein
MSGRRVILKVSRPIIHALGLKLFLHNRVVNFLNERWEKSVTSPISRRCGTGPHRSVTVSRTPRQSRLEGVEFRAR